MFSVDDILDQHLPCISDRPVLHRTSRFVLRRLLHERELQQFQHDYPHLVGIDFVEQVLDYFNFSYSVRDNEKERIPSSGRIVIIANHPIGSLDVLALIKLLSEVRTDIQIVANSLLLALSPLRSLVLPVNNMGGSTPKEGLRHIMQHLNNEGPLIIFPAGEVSRLRPQGARDTNWRSGFLRIADASRAPILPIYVHGRNSSLFYGTSILCKPLSTFLLVGEMFRHRSQDLPLRIGEMIPWHAYHRNGIDRRQQVKLLRKHLYRIGQGRRGVFATQSAIAPPENRCDLQRAIKACDELGTTTDGKRILLYQHRASSPIMRELGRLRETAFRAVGEGSQRRHDYLEIHPSPNLNRIAKEGLRVQALRPVFPTKTFPNHYSLVTGLFPEQHGIVDNNMYDPLSDKHFSLGNRAAVQSSEWWQGEPIWVTAERQGVSSATFFFPGSEAEIGGYRPSQWFQYDAGIANSDRVNTVLEWLSLPPGKQPRLITLYFSDVDTAGHNHGSLSSQVATAMSEIDAQIGRLYDALQARGWHEYVDIMIVSDHGMAEVDLHQHIVIDELFDSALAEEVIYSRELTSIFPRAGEKERILEQLRTNLGAGATVLTAASTPAEWARADHPRIAPIRVLADIGHVLLRREWLDRSLEQCVIQRPRGGHGYDNREDDMLGIFIANGPSFGDNAEVGIVDIVDLYNVMARIMGVDPAPNSGNPKVADLLLDSPRQPAH